MATAKAYGSITIVDIGDLGTLSVYPESNLPNSVIYDPNKKSGNYNPDWSQTNLRLSPVVYYGGQLIQLNDKDLAITWTKKIGSTGTEGAIDSSKGENVSNKILSVSQNLLVDSSPILTYICLAEYTEPQSGTKLTAKGQFSVSLISQPTSIKSCSIMGESVFLYNTDQSLKGADTIVLEANTVNCEIGSWAYKKPATKEGEEDQWIPFKDASGTTNINSVKLEVKESAGCFFNDVATIKLNTTDPYTYDIHTITKIRDGAAGTATFNAILSNEDMFVPCNSKGEIETGGLDNAITEIRVYEGSKDISNDTRVTINATPDTGILVTKISGKEFPTYQVTQLDVATTGKVVFTIIYKEDEKNTKTATKTLYLTKLKAGVNGTSPILYEIAPESITVNRKKNEVQNIHIYTPEKIKVSATQKEGTEVKDKKGVFVVTGTKQDGNTEEVYRTTNVTNGESSLNNGNGWTISTEKQYKFFLVEFFELGGTTNRLDRQTITVISDGDKGDQGEPSISFDFGNYGDVIPCENNGNTAVTTEKEISFAAYRGIERIPCKAEVVDGLLPNQISLGKEIVDADENANGHIYLKFHSGVGLGGQDTGYITVTLTTLLTGEGVSNSSTTKTYTWTKNKQAKNGDSAILLRTFAPTGNVINNNENDVTLQCILSQGSTTISENVNYQWYLHNGVSYTEINAQTPGGYTGYTTNSLTVPKGAVDSYAAYKISATYAQKTYEDYITVQDKTDPLQIEIYSTLGDKITNGVGVGCIYARVYKNGEELDYLTNLTVSENEPSTYIAGDVWAKIDKKDKTILIQRYSEGGQWIALESAEAPYNWECNYIWTFSDYNGNASALNGKSSITHKFIYIDGSLIDKKKQFNLRVEEKPIGNS